MFLEHKTVSLTFTKVLTTFSSRMTNSSWFAQDCSYFSTNNPMSWGNSQVLDKPPHQFFSVESYSPSAFIKAEPITKK